VYIWLNKWNIRLAFAKILGCLDKFLYFISLEVFVKVAEIFSYTVRDSGFHHKLAENCPLLGYYTASIGNSLPMLQDNILALDF
jgi:hypothetical protein